MDGVWVCFRGCVPGQLDVRVGVTCPGNSVLGLGLCARATRRRDVAAAAGGGAGEGGGRNIETCFGGPNCGVRPITTGGEACNYRG